MAPTTPLPRVICLLSSILIFTSHLSLLNAENKNIEQNDKIDDVLLELLKQVESEHQKANRNRDRPKTDGSNRDDNRGPNSAHQENGLHKPTFDDYIKNGFTDNEDKLVDNINDKLNQQRFNRELEANASRWMRDFNDTYVVKIRQITDAEWQYATNLTTQNADKSDTVSGEFSDWVSDNLPDAKRWLETGEKIPFADKLLLRMLLKVTRLSNVPASTNSSLNRRVNQLVSHMTDIYGKAEVEHNGQRYALNPNLTDIMTRSRDYDERLWAWLGWRNETGPKMKSAFGELVTTMNYIAIEGGFGDVGESWRLSNFDEDQSLITLVDDVWRDVKPLYEQLFTYVRTRVIQTYPDANIPPDGPLPAHLVGDMWSQEWGNMEDLVLPYPQTPMFDVTQALVDQDYSVQDMFKLTEGFFTSLDLEPMTDTFWEKSMLVRPSNRPVQCHGSAFDFYRPDDYRIKMCTNVNMDDLFTIHHEMGHITYFMEYSQQPGVLRGGANSAFHEAIGDTMSLSAMTANHVRSVGLLNDSHAGSDPTRPIEESDINFLMRVALAKIAFLPFGYLMDKWRWDVFSAKIKEEDYNTAWWEYREKYQGIISPVNRGPGDFDPGAKFHIPSNVPYIRYFVSFVIQFQFHQALCDASGHQGPLHRCDIYQSPEAGQLLRSVLSLGQSLPWREVMKIFTGTDEVNTDAIFDYFRPLMDHLREANQGEYIGWR